MFLRIFFIFLYSFSFNTAEAQVEYKSVSLTSMPLELQEIFQDSFYKSQLRRFLMGSSGSRLLGINMLFTDAFSMGRVAIKYDLEGNFEMDRTYRFHNFNVIHFQISKKTIAVMYSGISSEYIQSIIHLIKSRSTSTTLLSFIMNEAHAGDDCDSKGVTLNLDKDVPIKSATSMVGSCLDSIRLGAEEGSVGMVETTWSLVATEFKEIMSNPSKRMGEYWENVSQGLKKVWNFVESVAGMVVNPTQGMKTLKAKFGEIGLFFVEVYQNIQSLPFQSQMDFICNMIGSMGIDMLLSAITLGAAGGKLSLSLAKILMKLSNISKIAGKGLSLSFKTLNTLGDDVIEGIDKIIESGNMDIFDKKLKAINCAI
jgi:hypothetical protein